MSVETATVHKGELGSVRRYVRSQGGHVVSSTPVGRDHYRLSVVWEMGVQVRPGLKETGLCDS